MTRVAALGGGHGLAASLTALRRVTDDLTGIVTVADDGGSSGRLREELGVLPPGDLRMALAALSGDDERGRQWASVLQHRFQGDGPLAGHSLGNLLIAAIWDQLGDHVAGLDLVGDLLGSRGRVLPMAAVPLDIEADVRMDATPEAVTVVRGQAEVASVDGQVLAVRLDPHDPPACPEAVAAVHDADWVVVGPGSWFTSVMPTLLVPQLREALMETNARRALVLNLPGDKEATGFTVADHLETLAAHAPGLTLDVVLVDQSVVGRVRQVKEAAATLGARIVIGDLARFPGSDQHDPARLADAFGGFLTPA
ncbi:MAG: uridine diphosphate-N-acetylglucosamine-binding protein YvcK [Aeromicrobium sp.]|uniref:gluconeogenesis factor YvcK family protein n=1 Tax=Aeromicrobium sp. TaxID=1871063 RepID=UPI0039E6BC20